MNAVNNKIACLVGPSGSGKASIFSRIRKEYDVKPIVPYTTRPMRVGEKEGREYHFVSREQLELMEQKKLLIERRDYNTKLGIWSYATGKEAIELEKYNYAARMPWNVYQKFLNYYSSNNLGLMYIEIADGLRLERCLNREMNTSQQYEEMCRRFLADAEDFRPELIERYKPKIISNNGSLEETMIQVDEYLIEKLGFKKKSEVEKLSKENKMRIYFAHSKNFDYISDYYNPIEKNQVLQNENLIFPHKNNTDNKHSRDFYTNLDLFIAEVSYRATGLGIELGWAWDDNIPIYCFHKRDIKPNGSLKCITNNIIEYSSSEELSNKVEQIVNSLKRQKNLK